MDLIDQLIKYWQIIGALVLAVVVWTKHTVEVKGLKESHDETNQKLEVYTRDLNLKMNKLDDKVVLIDGTYVRLQNDIVEIKTSLRYIEQKLDSNSKKLNLS